MLHGTETAKYESKRCEDAFFYFPEPKFAAPPPQVSYTRKPDGDIEVWINWKKEIRVRGNLKPRAPFCFAPAFGGWDGGEQDPLRGSFPHATLIWRATIQIIDFVCANLVSMLQLVTLGRILPVFSCLFPVSVCSFPHC